MSRVATLFNGFMLRVAIAALAVVVASAHPIALRFITVLGIVFLVAYALAWLLDDWLKEALKVESDRFYACLIATGITVLLGMGLGLWLIF